MLRPCRLIGLCGLLLLLPWSAAAAPTPDKIELEKVPDAPTAWRYRGEAFTLSSRASEELTRRCVMRLEQMFAAYRRVLPPRGSPQQELRIEIFGTLADYQSLARSLGLPIENAALYHAPRNLVAAGSDLSKLAEQLQQVQAQHDAARQQVEQLRTDLPGKLKKRQEQLAAAGGSESDRRMALNIYRRQIEKELDTREDRVADYDRQNDASFEQHAGRMLALLYHEAFHAYLENYVYPQSGHDVPRWLNEGLAQIFEHAVVDGKALRIDVPHAPSVACLQENLKSTEPLTLAKVLSADHRNFLVPHGGAAGNKTLYAYAWGLTYYLALVKPALSGDALDDYASSDAAALGPIPRFERLVGQPLPEFESQWRKWLASQSRGKRSAN